MAHPLPVLVIEIVFPVEERAMLVPRTHTTITSVPTLYAHVSVRIRHHTDPFESIAEAIVEPSASVQRSSDIVVSPSRRSSE